MRVSLALALVVLGAVAVLAERPVLFRRDRISLDDWSQDAMPTGTPRPDWSVTGPNSVLAEQSADSVPTVYLDPEDDVNLSYTTNLQVATALDNDYIGVVVGFTPGAFTSPSANYVLIDWKQGDESGAPAGLAAWRIQGAVTALQLRTHTGPNIRLISRASNLGSQGWEDNTNHTLAVAITGGRLVVRVDGDVEIDAAAVPSRPGFPAGFPSAGRFGFYSFSQEASQFIALSREPVIGGVAERPITFVRRFSNNDDDGAAGYRLTVDWGDDSSQDFEAVSADEDGGIVRIDHTFEEEGVYLAEFTLVSNGSNNRDVFYAVYRITEPIIPTDPVPGGECDPENIERVAVQVVGGRAFAETDDRCLCIIAVGDE